MPLFYLFLSLRLARDFLDYIWLHRFIITTIIIIFTQSLDTLSLYPSHWIDWLIDTLALHWFCTLRNLIALSCWSRNLIFIPLARKLYFSPPNQSLAFSLSPTPWSLDKHRRLLPFLRRWTCRILLLFLISRVEFFSKFPLIFSFFASQAATFKVIALARRFIILLPDRASSRLLTWLPVAPKSNFNFLL